MIDPDQAIVIAQALGLEVSRTIIIPTVAIEEQVRSNAVASTRA